MKIVIRYTVVLFLLGVSFLLYSCGSDTAPTSPGEGANVVYVTDDVAAETTWYSGNIYVIQDFDFFVTSTLTIQPGVIIKFTPDGPCLTVYGSGSIIAQARSDSLIVFTSFKDDVGGDTNEDGSQTQPAAGDWGGISHMGDPVSIFNYCVFSYGGDGTSCLSALSTLELSLSRATITNCVFSHNTGGEFDDSYYGALDASTADTGTIITDNRFYDNVLPLSIGTRTDLDDSNTFQSPDGAQTNTYNGIFVHTGRVENNLSLGETEVAFVMTGDFWLDTDVLVTLADNVVLKCTSGIHLEFGYGSSAFVNHDGTGVFFTSFKDDSHKGDANGDGDTTAPAEGDWLGIYDVSIGTIGDWVTWPNILYDSQPAVFTSGSRFISTESR